MRMYILEGPAECGNVFGYAGHAVPAGRWAVAEFDEYSNGGCGPIAVVSTLFASREAAEAEIVRLKEENYPC